MVSQMYIVNVGMASWLVFETLIIHQIVMFILPSLYAPLKDCKCEQKIQRCLSYFVELLDSITDNHLKYILINKS